jgi:hypothetical protein
MTTTFTTFTTRSGSVYQVDTANQKVRRLEGEADPTPRQGKDGEWKSYEWIGCLSDYILVGNEGKIKVGEGALIVWVQSEHQSLSSFGGVKTTLTSDVIKITEDSG